MAMNGNTPVINNKVVEPEPPVDLTTPFFVKDVSGSDNVVTIQKTGEYAPSVTFYKSTDGENWTSMGSTTTSGITATVPANGKLYLKSNCGGQGFYNLMEDEYTRMYFSGNCNIGGNILSLLWATDFTSRTTLANNANYAFSGFFGGAKIVDASKLLLPTNTVASCYDNMFRDCTLLTTAPTLPATTLAASCYNYMFGGCTNLSYIKCLATTNIQGNCGSWLSGVSATGTFVKAAGVTWPTGSSGIPSGWTVEEVSQ